MASTETLSAADWLRASHALSARRVAAMAAAERLLTAPLAAVSAHGLRTWAGELIEVAALLPCASMAEQMLDRAKACIAKANRVDILAARAADTRRAS